MGEPRDEQREETPVEAGEKTVTGYDSTGASLAGKGGELVGAEAEGPVADARDDAEERETEREA